MVRNSSSTMMYCSSRGSMYSVFAKMPSSLEAATVGETVAEEDFLGAGETSRRADWEEEEVRWRFEGGGSVAPTNFTVVVFVAQGSFRGMARAGMGGSRTVLCRCAEEARELDRVWSSCRS